uniref:S phase cyclin A-associated protein in the endoplasmic reticulum N-terminal domain-containing protein n=1 Tax=Chromera velia CCMP2878 TaxID=1169474 RepID=A0A0G4F1A7_9ALVE|eukprot:Cvel_2607.t1-p1 / transcript=Cvel_2607.t1 / gene=Cvel_2607 / organism=Chromera_velia_CCMP2878 / gene_product=S phase cyclin A-associated protein in the, putative / transcript_product=S phase cyclin A-associated protein in the, putative / location=Cvel_scaffold103:37979-54098(-) / protein_length=2666 / sequence_SO=supercontig / SO=protein_coding / is_pseudo=false
MSEISGRALTEPPDVSRLESSDFEGIESGVDMETVTQIVADLMAHEHTEDGEEDYEEDEDRSSKAGADVEIETEIEVEVDDEDNEDVSGVLPSPANSLGVSSCLTAGSTSMQAGDFDGFALRARLWTESLSRLRRSIDEIYALCEFESDPDCVGSVTQILKDAEADFSQLVERFHLQEFAHQTAREQAQSLEKEKNEREREREKDLLQQAEERDPQLAGKETHVKEGGGNGQEQSAVAGKDKVGGLTCMTESGGESSVTQGGGGSSHSHTPRTATHSRVVSHAWEVRRMSAGSEQGEQKPPLQLETALSMLQSPMHGHRSPGRRPPAPTARTAPSPPASSVPTPTARSARPPLDAASTVSSSFKMTPAALQGHETPVSEQQYSGVAAFPGSLQQHQRQVAAHNSFSSQGAPQVTASSSSAQAQQGAALRRGRKVQNAPLFPAGYRAAAAEPPSPPPKSGNVSPSFQPGSPPASTHRAGTGGGDSVGAVPLPTHRSSASMSSSQSWRRLPTPHSGLNSVTEHTARGKTAKGGAEGTEAGSSSRGGTDLRDIVQYVMDAQRALHMRFSSPDRYAKKAPVEVLRRQEERQRRAMEFRFSEDVKRTRQSLELDKKIQRARERKERELETKQDELLRKMTRAKEQYEASLREVSRRARTESHKQQIIAFIKDELRKNAAAVLEGRLAQASSCRQSREGQYRRRLLDRARRISAALQQRRKKETQAQEEKRRQLEGKEKLAAERRQLHLESIRKKGMEDERRISQVLQRKKVMRTQQGSGPGDSPESRIRRSLAARMGLSVSPDSLKETDGGPSLPFTGPSGRGGTGFGLSRSSRRGDCGGSFSSPERSPHHYVNSRRDHRLQEELGDLSPPAAVSSFPPNGPGKGGHGDSGLPGTPSSSPRIWRSDDDAFCASGEGEDRGGCRQERGHEGRQGDKDRRQTGDSEGSPLGEERSGQTSTASLIYRGSGAAGSGSRGDVLDREREREGQRSAPGTPSTIMHTVSVSVSEAEKEKEKGAASRALGDESFPASSSGLAGGASASAEKNLECQSVSAVTALHRDSGAASSSSSSAKPNRHEGQHSGGASLMMKDASTNTKATYAAAAAAAAKKEKEKEEKQRGKAHAGKGKQPGRQSAAAAAAGAPAGPAGTPASLPMDALQRQAPAREGSHSHSVSSFASVLSAHSLTVSATVTGTAASVSVRKNSQETAFEGNVLSSPSSSVAMAPGRPGSGIPASSAAPGSSPKEAPDSQPPKSPSALMGGDRASSVATPPKTRHTFSLSESPRWIFVPPRRPGVNGRAANTKTQQPPTAVNPSRSSLEAATSRQQQHLHGGGKAHAQSELAIAKGRPDAKNAKKDKQKEKDKALRGGKDKEKEEGEERPTDEKLNEKELSETTAPETKSLTKTGGGPKKRREKEKAVGETHEKEKGEKEKEQSGGAGAKKDSSLSAGAGGKLVNRQTHNRKSNTGGGEDPHSSSISIPSGGASSSFPSSTATTSESRAQKHGPTSPPPPHSHKARQHEREREKEKEREREREEEALLFRLPSKEKDKEKDATDKEGKAKREESQRNLLAAADALKAFSVKSKGKLQRWTAVALADERSALDACGCGPAGAKRSRVGKLVKELRQLVEASSDPSVQASLQGGKEKESSSSSSSSSCGQTTGTGPSSSPSGQSISPAAAAGGGGVGSLSPQQSVALCGLSPSSWEMCKVEQTLRELCKVLDASREGDTSTFLRLGGAAVLLTVLEGLRPSQVPSDLPSASVKDTIVFALKLLGLLAKSSVCRSFLLLTGRATVLVDFALELFQGERRLATGEPFREVQQQRDLAQQTSHQQQQHQTTESLSTPCGAVGTASGSSLPPLPSGGSSVEDTWEEMARSGVVSGVVQPQLLHVITLLLKQGGALVASAAVDLSLSGHSRPDNKHEREMEKEEEDGAEKEKDKERETGDDHSTAKQTLAFAGSPVLSPAKPATAGSIAPQTPTHTQQHNSGGGAGPPLSPSRVAVSSLFLFDRMKEEFALFAASSGLAFHLTFEFSKVTGPLDLSSSLPLLLVKGTSFLGALMGQLSRHWCRWRCITSHPKCPPSPVLDALLSGITPAVSTLQQQQPSAAGASANSGGGTGGATAASASKTGQQQQKKRGEKEKGGTEAARAKRGGGGGGGGGASFRTRGTTGVGGGATSPRHVTGPPGASSFSSTRGAKAAAAGAVSVKSPPLQVSVSREELAIAALSRIFEDTALFGGVTLMASLLLFDGPPRAVLPPRVPQASLLVCAAVVRVINHAARLQLRSMQRVLGRQSNELVHLAAYLLDYCTPRLDHQEDCRDILHDVVFLLGHFCLDNPEGQTIMRVGSGQNLLSRLASLPMNYFVDEKLKEVLFPTLIASTFRNPENLKVLSSELSILPIRKYLAGKEKERQKEDMEHEGGLRGSVTQVTGSEEKERGQVGSGRAVTGEGHARKEKEKPATPACDRHMTAAAASSPSGGSFSHKQQTHRQATVSATPASSSSAAGTSAGETAGGGQEDRGQQAVASLPSGTLLFQSFSFRFPVSCLPEAIVFFSDGEKDSTPAPAPAPTSTSATIGGSASAPSPPCASPTAAGGGPSSAAVSLPSQVSQVSSGVGGGKTAGAARRATAVSASTAAGAGGSAVGASAGTNPSLGGQSASGGGSGSVEKGEKDKSGEKET